jgi:hypothetical protein
MEEGEQIPKLRLNIGKFHLRLWLTGPPGGEIYEIVDTCDFEVVRGGIPIWWRPDSCTHEEFLVKQEFTVEEKFPIKQTEESSNVL